VPRRQSARERSGSRDGFQVGRSFRHGDSGAGGLQFVWSTAGVSEVRRRGVAKNKARHEPSAGAAKGGTRGRMVVWGPSTRETGARRLRSGEHQGGRSLHGPTMPAHDDAKRHLQSSTAPPRAGLFVSKMQTARPGVLFLRFTDQGPDPFVGQKYPFAASVHPL